MEPLDFLRLVVYHIGMNKLIDPTIRKAAEELAAEIIKERQRKGGMATFKKYGGRKYMSELVKRRWAKVKKKKI